MIGVDHIWIHINEEYNLSSLPQKSYITYVPNNYQIWDHKAHFRRKPQPKDTMFHFFQTPTQLECIYRARQANLDWLILTDVDEFVTLSNVTDPTGAILKQYLDTVPNQDSIGGLQMNSEPYGYNKKRKDPPTDKREALVFDYVWRRYQNPGTRKMARYKHIVRPFHVEYNDVHYVRGGLRQVEVNANVLRINHYKTSYRKVFQTNPPGLAIDTYMQDTFGARLVEALKGTKNFTRYLRTPENSQNARTAE
jgi:hypothetical protein